jgi:hypothetical protein
VACLQGTAALATWPPGCLPSCLADMLAGGRPCCPRPAACLQADGEGDSGNPLGEAQSSALRWPWPLPTPAFLDLLEPGQEPRGLSVAVPSVKTAFDL